MRGPSAWSLGILKLVLLGLLGAEGQTLTGPANDEFYTGVNILYHIPITLAQDANQALNASFTLITKEAAKDPSGVPNTTFVVPTSYADIEDLSSTINSPQVCLDDQVAIHFFQSKYLLPCSLACRERPALKFAVMSEFAGVEEFTDVLTSNAFPTDKCLLGPKFTAKKYDAANTQPHVMSFERMQNLLNDMQYLSSSLYCDTANVVQEGMGCDTLEIRVQLYAAPAAGTGFVAESELSLTLIGKISQTNPNLPPTFTGTPGVEEAEVSAEVLLNPQEITDPDADFLTLKLESTGLVKIVQLRAPPPVNPATYSEPEFEPVFFQGGLNAYYSVIEINVTLDQAQRAVQEIYVKSDTLGTTTVTFSVDDQGRTGYPALGTTLSAQLQFSYIVKPSNTPPSIFFINTDETFRFDWRPGVKYLKGGQEVTIRDEMFPCGGDTVFGYLTFPKNGSGTGAPGWQGSIPEGEGSSPDLLRDCEEKPSTFWKEGEKVLYVTLDEGGKGRAFVQMDADPSVCGTSGRWKVTMAIQNANLSRINIPKATIEGYTMDWFECDAGAWYCETKNPYFSLDNSDGAVDRLQFHYDQQHRHLADGYNDYRMTFSGNATDIREAIKNVTITFPWLNEAYDGSDKITPWPFKSWPRTGRSLLGSNILRVTIEDMPSMNEYEYLEREHLLWTVNGAYRIENMNSENDAITACSEDPTCYGFQWLTFAQRQSILDDQQNMIPSIGIGETSGRPELMPGDPFIPGLGFSDRPPNNLGQGSSPWDGLTHVTIDWATVTVAELPNAFFFRKPFEEYDIQPYTYNALTYTKQIKMKLCLGAFPKTERMLDIRVLREPINTPPILTAEKPVWRIQQSYEFFLPGVRLWDEDAAWYNGYMKVVMSGTRGAFTNPDTTGLVYQVGDGTGDEITQTFLCRYRDCQRAIGEIRYQSADTAGTDIVTVFVDDLGNSGELGSLTGSVSLTLSLASGPYNKPPTINIPGLDTRVTYEFQRVDISGITVRDEDVNNARWDKPYPEGFMTITMQINAGVFDVLRLRKRGLFGSLFLGPAEEGSDPDCPCLSGDTCPCNGYILSQYVKFSGYLWDIQDAVQEVAVYLFKADEAVLIVTVNDNCNTGFSDDSGSQRPCLTDTDSVVIRVVPRPEGPKFLHTDPVEGVDGLFGTAVMGAAGEITLDRNVSLLETAKNDGGFTGMTIKLVSGTGAPQSKLITSYNATTRVARAAFIENPDNTTRYSIVCGDERLPCRSLQGVIDASIDYSIVLVGPGVYSGPSNRLLNFRDRTIELRSTRGFNYTVIDCDNTGSVGTYSPTNTSRLIMDGFSIRNCGNKQGGALTFRFIQGERVNLVFPNGSDASKCQGFACLKTPIFRRCYFYNNVASSMGGALFIKDGRPVFEDCIFFSNSANIGGAVYIRGGMAVFRRCTFYGNLAQLEAGGVMVNGGRTIIDDCIFSMNAATTNGGGLAILAGELEMFDTSITYNHAGLVDGGVHVTAGRTSFSSCTENGNIEGRHENTLLDDIQIRRQQSFFSTNGFHDPYPFPEPFLFHD